MSTPRYQNVILLTTDATGIELVNEKSAPQLTDLLRAGIHCPNTYAHGNPTQFSFPAIMTSSLPLDFGGYDWGVFDRPVTLAEVMRRAGFTTYGFSTTVWLSSLFGYARGFDRFFAIHNPIASWNGSCTLYLHYWKQLFENHRIRSCEYIAQIEQLLTRWIPYVNAHCENDIKTAGEIPVSDYGRFGWHGHMQGVRERFRRVHDSFQKSPKNFIAQNLRLLEIGKLQSLLDLPRASGDSKYVDARQTFEAILGILREDSAQSKFVWAHFRDVHDFKQLPQAADPRTGTPTRQLAMTYWDAQLRRFLATLHSNGQDECSLIIVFSDHGSGPACSLQDHSLRVPLVFWSPKLEPKRVESSCGLWDLAPTVLDLIGLPPESSFQGTSILQLHDKQSRLLISEHAGRGPCDLLRKRINMAISYDSYRLLFSEMESESGFSPKVELNEISQTAVPKHLQMRLVEAFQQRCQQLRAALNRS